MWWVATYVDAMHKMLESLQCKSGEKNSWWKWANNDSTHERIVNTFIINIARHMENTWNWAHLHLASIGSLKAGMLTINHARRYCKAPLCHSSSGIKLNEGTEIIVKNILEIHSRAFYLENNVLHCLRWMQVSHGAHYMTDCPAGFTRSTLHDRLSCKAIN